MTFKILIFKMILPEEILSNLPKCSSELKTHLIHHFNAETLKKYQQSGQFLTKEEILIAMPGIVTTFYKPEKVKVNIEYQQLKDVVDNHYTVTESPTLKFKELITHFNKLTKSSWPTSWSSKYEAGCPWLTTEKVIDQRFADRGGSGTCYVYLKLKSIPDLD